MEKNYDVLEFYKIVNNLIDLSKLEVTKEKFIDIDILKSKSELDKEMILMQEFIDYYKYDDGLDITNISNIQRYINSIELIGSYLSSEELVDLKKNLVTYRISRNRTKNVRDKYKSAWILFSDVDDLKDIEKYIEQVKKVSEKLVEYNPENEQIYISNTNRYISELEELKATLNNDSTKKALVMSEGVEYIVKSCGKPLL